MEAWDMKIVIQINKQTPWKCDHLQLSVGGDLKSQEHSFSSSWSNGEVLTRSCRKTQAPSNLQYIISAPIVSRNGLPFSLFCSVYLCICSKILREWSEKFNTHQMQGKNGWKHSCHLYHIPWMIAMRTRSIFNIDTCQQRYWFQETTSDKQVENFDVNGFGFCKLDVIPLKWE